MRLRHTATIWMNLAYRIKQANNKSPGCRGSSKVVRLSDVPLFLWFNCQTETDAAKVETDKLCKERDRARSAYKSLQSEQVDLKYDNEKLRKKLDEAREQLAGI